MGVEYQLDLGFENVGDEASFHVSGAEALPRVGDIIFITQGEVRRGHSEMIEIKNPHDYDHEYVVKEVYHHVLVEAKGFFEGDSKELYRARSNGIPTVFAKTKFDYSEPSA